MTKNPGEALPTTLSKNAHLQGRARDVGGGEGVERGGGGELWSGSGHWLGWRGVGERRWGVWS